MKQLICLLLTLSLLCSLCACGGQPQQSPEPSEQTDAAVPADPNLGRYTCTAVTMDGMDLGPSGQWLELSADGKALLFLSGEADEAQWSLTGTSFTLTMGSETVATGTLADHTLTVNLMGMDCTFVRQEPGTSPSPGTDGSAPAEFTPTMGTFSCRGLYSVTYPLDSFQAPGDGLTDLVTPTGTRIWFTSLDTRADANQWRKDFETKCSDPAILQHETMTLTAGEFPAEGVIYEDAEGWHAAVLVDFGRNRGSDGRSMAAAVSYLSAPTRETVWNETIQTMVSSLKLGQ